MSIHTYSNRESFWSLAAKQKQPSLSDLSLLGKRRQYDTSQSSTGIHLIILEVLQHQLCGPLNLHTHVCTLSPETLLRYKVDMCDWTCFCILNNSCASIHGQ